jgi:hypothetical protein
MVKFSTLTDIYEERLREKQFEETYLQSFKKNLIDLSSLSEDEIIQVNVANLRQKEISELDDNFHGSSRRFERQDV